MNRRLFLCAAALAPALVQPLAALARDLPPTWDNLVLVKSKRLEAVYLLPGADFRTYTKVMLDPTEVAFRKDWMRDYNEQARVFNTKVNGFFARFVANHYGFKPAEYFEATPGSEKVPEVKF